MLYKVNMATVEQGSVSFIPSAGPAVLDPSIMLELFIFKPILYLSVCVIGLAALKASINAVVSALIRNEPSTPSLYYKESAFSRFLLRKVPRFTESYRTPRWCLNPDIQYLTTIFFSDPKTDKIRFNRQYYQLKDRGLVALDWAIPATSFCNVNYCVWSNLKKSKTLLLILPDFNKNALSLGTVCSEALSRGFRPVVFHRRGHGGCPLTTPKLQAYGDPSDLRQTVKYISSCSPTSKLTALGYGVGADLLMAYLGEFGSSSFMSACVAISPIYDPELLWGQGLRQPYSLATNIAYKKLIGTHSWALRRTVDIGRVLKVSRFDEAERILHSKSPTTSLLPTRNEGTEKTQTFWERNAPLRDADDIETPLLCVSSRDDPFLTSVSIPYEIFQLYPNLVLALTEYGGHSAFFHDPSDASKSAGDDYSWPWRLSSWADLLAINFLQATLEFSALEARCSRKHKRY